MKVLTTLTVSGGLNMASNAVDTFTIGTPLEHNDGNVDKLNVYANAEFFNNVVLGSSSADTVTVHAQLTASSIAATSISASGISDFETATFNNVVIQAGNIDGTVIGDNYQNTGHFTDLIANNTTISGNLNVSGAIGCLDCANKTTTIYAEATNGTIIIGGIGTTVSASNMNISGNLNVSGSFTTPNLNLNGSQVETAWTAYTPVWTAGTTNPSIGNGTIEGYYKVIGKTCFVRGNIAMGSTTTFGSGEWYVSMPFTASHADAILMTVTLLDNGSAWYNATMNGARAGFNTKAAMQFVNYNNGTADDVNATHPFTWANSDRFIWNGSFEIA